MIWGRLQVRRSRGWEEVVQEDFEAGPGQLVWVVVAWEEPVDEVVVYSGHSEEEEVGHYSGVGVELYVEDLVVVGCSEVVEFHC